jgi:hypothetical protein
MEDMRYRHLCGRYPTDTHIPAKKPSDRLLRSVNPVLHTSQSQRYMLFVPTPLLPPHTPLTATKDLDISDKMKAAPSITKQHTTGLPIATLTNPLLQRPITLLGSIILLNRTNLPVPGVNTITRMRTLLLVLNILAKAAEFQITTAITDGKALGGIRGEARGEGGLDGAATRDTVARGETETRFDGAGFAAGCGGCCCAGATAVVGGEDHTCGALAHKGQCLLVETFWARGTRRRWTGALLERDCDVVLWDGRIAELRHELRA